VVCLYNFSRGQSSFAFFSKSKNVTLNFLQRLHVHVFSKQRVCVKLEWKYLRGREMGEGEYVDAKNVRLDHGVIVCCRNWSLIVSAERLQRRFREENRLKRMNSRDGERRRHSEIQRDTRREGHREGHSNAAAVNPLMNLTRSIVKTFFRRHGASQKGDAMAFEGLHEKCACIHRVSQIKRRQLIFALGLQIRTDFNENG